VSDALPPRAVLDSDVIFSRVLYELFGRAAATAGVLTLLWSDELLAEAKRALIERKPLTAAVAVGLTVGSPGKEEAADKAADSRPQQERERSE